MTNFTASFIVVNAATSSTVAGTFFTTSVTVLDQFSNVVRNYTGTIHFKTSDPSSSVVLPADYTFTSGIGSTFDNGVHTFTNGMKLITVGNGNQTLTATDTSNIATGNTTISVIAAAATSFTITAPATRTAGSAFNIVVTAFDTFGNVATGYTGTATFSTSDPGTGTANPTLPGNYTFVAGDRGVHTLSVTLVTASPPTRTVTDTDSVTSTIMGSASITVTPSTATKLVVSAVAAETAGVAFTTTVTAFDTFGNIATGYSGVVHFSSTDSNASVVLPADYTFVPGSDAGLHVFTGGVKLITSGSQTVTAADSANSISGNVTVTITANVATRFTVTLPPTSTAGNQLTAVVTALDTFGNTATGYTGVVHFSSSDAGASVVLPPNYTFASGDAGIHTFSSGVELVTAATQTVTATDAGNGSIKGSATVSVSAASAAHLKVTAPNPTAGVAFTITVTAQDTFNNTAPTYTGTVHFNKSDNGIGSALPSDYTFVPANAGIQTFGVTLVTSGLQSLTATDTVTASISGSAVVTVAAASATSLTVTAPAGTVAGVPFSVVVTAKDTFGNIATGYSGVVHFTKSDSNAGAAVPADYTFVPGSDAGVHTFSAGVKLATVGSQTVTATDKVTSSISGSAAVTVTPASAASLSVSAPSSASAAIPFSVTVTALDSFGNVATGYSGVVHFRTSDGGAVALPADYTFVPGSDAGVHTFANGVKLVTLGCSNGDG